MNEENEKKSQKLPEFIILDEGEEYTEFPRFKKTELKEASWKLKIVFLLASFFSFLWTISSLLFFVLVGGINLITFNYFAPLKRAASLYRSWFKGGAAVTLGLSTAVFNVSLGIIIIAFYFSQTQEDWRKNVFTRVMYPHMKDYM